MEIPVEEARSAGNIKRVVQYRIGDNVITPTAKEGKTAFSLSSPFTGKKIHDNCRRLGIGHFVH